MSITKEEFYEISTNKKDPNYKYVVMEYKNGITIYYIKL